MATIPDKVYVSPSNSDVEVVQLRARVAELEATLTKIAKGEYMVEAPTWKEDEFHQRLKGIIMPALAVKGRL